MEKETFTVRRAVEAAMNYARSLTAFMPNDDLRLEETVRNANGNWSITLSTGDSKNFLSPFQRSYKSYVVNAKTGQVQSMKVRMFDSEVA